MQRPPFFRVLPFVLMLVLLAACSTRGGYQSPDWGADHVRQTSQNTRTPTEYQKALPQEQMASAAPVPVDQAPFEGTPIQQSAKIALLVPLSGQNAKLGQSMANAAQMALFDSGQENLQLILKDTKGTAEGARSGAQSAINEGANIILGPVFSEATRNIQPLARQANVPVLTFSTDWSLAGNGTYVMGFTPFDQVEEIIAYAASRNMKSIAVLAPASPYGDAVVGAYNTLAAQYGIRSAGFGYLPENGGNASQAVTSFINKIRDNHGGQFPQLDAVFIPSSPRTMVTVSELLTRNGLPPEHVKRLGTGLLDEQNIPPLAGTLFATASPQKKIAFERNYFQTFGEPAQRLATLAYDATALASILSQTNNTNNFQTVAAGYTPSPFDNQNITNPNGFAGVDGIFRFRPDGRIERKLAILEIGKDGQARVIRKAKNTFQ